MFKNDNTKHYFFLTREEIPLKEITESPFKIKDCRKVRKICFLPDGSVQTKVNICSCNSCMEGNFISCTTEKGKEYNKNMSNDSDFSDFESANESDNDSDDEDENQEKLYGIRAEHVTCIISKNSTIALYSSTNSFDLFYLCKVIDFGEAEGTLVDKFDHVIERDMKFIKCQYYQKEKEIKERCAIQVDTRRSFCSTFTNFITVSQP